MTDSLNSLKGVCKAWSNIRPRTSEMSGCFLSIWSFHMRDVSKKVSSRHITLKLAAARLHAWQRGSWWINLQLSLKKEWGFAWRSWIKYLKHLVLTRRGKKKTHGCEYFLKNLGHASSKPSCFGFFFQVHSHARCMSYRNQLRIFQHFALIVSAESYFQVLRVLQVVVRKFNRF